MTTYVLAYSQPHDIRLTGLRYLTNVSYPFTIVLHSAIHESMPPRIRGMNPRYATPLTSWVTIR